MMPSDWTELLGRSRIADLRRQAEYERLVNFAHHQRHGPAVPCAAWVRGWMQAGLPKAVGALLRRPSVQFPK
jgi:hypothetical protein